LGEYSKGKATTNRSLAVYKLEALVNVNNVPVEAIDLQPDLQYQEIPIKILDTITKRTRNSEVRICIVQWSRHGVEESTWEREDALKNEFPHLFKN
jgi:hypothetical protein